MPHTGPSIGIDFGTTNSSLAVITGGKLELLSFPSIHGMTRAIARAVLEQQKHAGRVQLKSFTGRRQFSSTCRPNRLAG